ncbi:MAG: urease accessory protein UreD [Bacteroidota bacterium]|nr:urease accessory protein UreD [Bacteroidota bacterium]
MSSSPGVLDGDEYRIKIELEKGCSLQLQTQSYQRLFSMKKKAFQHVEVFMDDRATFSFLPHPTVPHRDSNFAAVNKIYMSNGCTLTWGEVLTCGRKLNGELFCFSSYHNRSEIFLAGRLVVKENLLIEPLVADVSAIGQLEGYSHQASLIHVDASTDIKAMIADIRELLLAQENICSGISALQVNGVVIRLLGFKAEQLYNCLMAIGQLLAMKKNRVII